MTKKVKVNKYFIYLKYRIQIICNLKINRYHSIAFIIECQNNINYLNHLPPIYGLSLNQSLGIFCIVGIVSNV